MIPRVVIILCISRYSEVRAWQRSRAKMSCRNLTQYMHVLRQNQAQQPLGGNRNITHRRVCQMRCSTLPHSEYPFQRCVRRVSNPCWENFLSTMSSLLPWIKQVGGKAREKSMIGSTYPHDHKVHHHKSIGITTMGI